MRHKNNLSYVRTGRSVSQTLLLALIFPLVVMVAVDGAGYGQQTRREAITTIDVDAVHSRVERVGYLGAEPEEVGGENRGRDLHGSSHRLSARCAKSWHQRV